MANEKIENIIANFSKLSNVNCVLFIQNFLLEALESEDYFEWELIAKLMTLPETDREALTKALNDAIKMSQQEIAGTSVVDWFKKYLDKYKGVAKKQNTFFEFCTRTPEIQKLGRQDQIRLMRLFRMYDYLLVEPIQDLEYPVENILRFPMRLDSTPEEISAQVQTAGVGLRPAPPRTIAEKLPLRDLLRKYPAVGEQMITTGQLKLSHFDRPVRPSIRNWIYDYTSQLGQERHDSMQRMKYMFSSANGKNLTSLEREKLGIILKSFDENLPLPVDASRNEVVFVVSDQRSVNNPARFESRSESGGEQQNIRKTTVERSVSQKAPVSSQMIPPFPKSPHESFTKPYPRREAKPPVSPPKVRPSDQGSTFPSRQQSSRDSSRSNLSEMQFTNPYPKPGTHEPQLAARAENISNVRFDEGLPQKTSPARQNLPAPPQEVPQKSEYQKEPAKPSVPGRPKNVFYPHYGPEREVKPEPRIAGNIVDLSGE